MSAANITFTSPAAPGLDLTYYLWREGCQVTKTDKYKQTALLDFALAPIDSNFVKLGRGAYISVSSTTYPYWFTGFITNNPDLTYLGVGPNGETWGYLYHASADEYLLSLNPVGIIRTFFNVTAGSIIKSLANRLCPGIFDVTNVQAGPLLAQYVVDPTKSFYAVAQDLCEASSYVFYGNNHKLYFCPQDDATLPATVVDGNDKNFTPANLNITAVTTPIINDATVMGQIEPQQYVQEYFIGTGMTNQFPMCDSMFGADSSVFISESFSGSNLDTTVWNVYDHSGQYLQVLNGYLNCLGGSGNQSFDVSLQSVNAFPMEGNLRFTHGEFDFISGNGFIGSLWTQAVNKEYAGCLYGIVVQGTQLNPICDGSGDATQTVTININKRYCIRTLAHFSKAVRTVQPYSYVDANGVVQTVTTIPPGADTVTWQTYITEIDPVTGIVSNQWVWTNIGALTGVSDTYAIYAPAISDNLFCTVTGIQIGIPINCSLAMQQPVYFLNCGFDTWVDSTQTSGWSGMSADGVMQESTIVAEGSALRLIQQSDPNPYVAQYANAFGPTAPTGTPSLLSPGVAYNVQFQARRTAGMTTGTLKVVLDSGYSGGGTGVETGVSIPVSQIPIADFISFSGQLSPAMASIPADAALKVYLTGCTNTGESVYVDEVLVSTAWQYQIVGPNEIDAVDGIAPIATVVQPNSGSSTSSTYTGAPQYNAGQGVLTYFSNSTTEELNTPSNGAVVRLTYRSAGAAVGRSANIPSVEAEALAWGDSGYRSVVQMSYNPRPRTSVECELAAQALVSENYYQHYQGTYTQRSEFLATQPRAGAIIKFQNLSNMAVINAEQITQVSTIIDNKSPESFIHTISFGKPDNIQVFLDKIQNPVGSFQVTTDASSPSAIDTRAVGLVYAPDVIAAEMLSWDDNNIYVNTNQSLTVTTPGRNQLGQYFEVRFTDQCWGADDGLNLILRTNSQNITVPRSIRGQCFFIRQCSLWNYFAYSEDLTQTAWTMSGATVSNSRLLNPDYKYSQISSVVFGANGNASQNIGAAPPSGWAQKGCWSFSLNGAVGTNVTATVTSKGGTVATLQCPLTGEWERFSVPIESFPDISFTCTLSCASAATVQITRASIELGTDFETYYVKTKAFGTGGIYSRYSSVVRVAFPPPPVPLEAVPTIVLVNSDTVLVAPSVGDMVVQMDTSAGGFTVTLPPSASYVGQQITCFLVSYGTANGAQYFNAVVNAVPGDVYNGESTWTFNTQWQGYEYTGVA